MTHRSHRRRVIAPLSIVGVAIACTPTLDERLHEVLAQEQIEPLEYVDDPDSELVRLGEALFHDKELSGNRDIACGTCHHLDTRTSDALSLSIGTGGAGVGPERQRGTGVFTLRHAPDLFNRGAEGWDVLMWDGRIERGEPWPLPAGVEMPEAIADSVLAAQVMMQVAQRDTMRGHAGDIDDDGERNTLAELPDDDLPAIWSALMGRLLAIDRYVALFRDAFPQTSVAELGFEHAALAIAAYELEAFALPDSPWDRYVEGEDDAIVDPAKRGALLFFGEAHCGECHRGPLLTDLEFHNVCTPQVGAGLDWGRGGYSGVERERYAFRTPALRNVGFTAPYFHAGTHASLEAAVRYHLDPCAELRRYEGEDLDPRVRPLLLHNDGLYAEIDRTADPLALERIELSSEQISELVQFLEALADPHVVYDLGQRAPSSVPSGRPLD